MAKAIRGTKAVRATVTLESSVEFLNTGGTNVTIVVDGVRSVWWTPSRVTAHAAVYIAAIRAMPVADARGVTHLTFSTRANLVRRQVTGEWKKRATQLSGLHGIYMQFRGDFDDVDWIQSPRP